MELKRLQQSLILINPINLPKILTHREDGLKILRPKIVGELRAGLDSFLAQCGNNVVIFIMAHASGEVDSIGSPLNLLDLADVDFDADEIAQPVQNARLQGKNIFGVIAMCYGAYYPKLTEAFTACIVTTKSTKMSPFIPEQMVREFCKNTPEELMRERFCNNFFQEYKTMASDADEAWGGGDNDCWKLVVQDKPKQIDDNTQKQGGHNDAMYDALCNENYSLVYELIGNGMWSLRSANLAAIKDNHELAAAIKKNHPSLR